MPSTAARTLGILSAVAAAIALPQAADAGRRSVTVRLPPFDVAAGQNREICTYVPIPTRRPLEVSEVRIRHQGGTPEFGTHHMIVFAHLGNPADVENIEKKVVDDVACLNAGTGNPADLQLLATAQTVRSRQPMPKGTALHLEPVSVGRGDRKVVGLLLNSHWINGGVTPGRARAKIKLVFSKRRKVKRPLNPIFEATANAFLDVPPGETGEVSWSWGPGLPSFAGTFFGGGLENPSGPACVSMLVSHMHERGRLFTIDLVDRDGGRTRLYENVAYDNPPTLNLGPLLVEPGQTLEYRCLHDNASDVRLGCEEEVGVTPGESILDRIGESGLDLSDLGGIGFDSPSQATTGAAKHCTQAGPTPTECPPTDPEFPGRTFTGNCVPANLVFGFRSYDDMCIMPGYYYDADPDAPPGEACRL